jgi:tripartite-type tricarboxylate transporter receptor subunit TctC
MKFSFAAALAGAFLSLGATTVAADDFPSEPIRMYLAGGPGGMTDTTGRIIATKMEEILGVPIVVENRGGAGGMNARAAMMRDAPDGYTFVSTSSSHSAGATISGKDFKIDELAYIGGIMPQERVLFAGKGAPFSTLEEMWEYGKSNPITLASAGPWPGRVIQGMAVEKGLEIRTVPFDSGADASAALIGGHVMIAETGVGTSLWSASKGDSGIKILATLSDVESPLANLGMPEVRSIGEAGITNTVTVYYNFASRSDAPADRVQIISDAMAEALRDPGVIEQFGKFDLVPQWKDGPATEAMNRQVMENVVSLKKLLGN